MESKRLLLLKGSPRKEGVTARMGDCLGAAFAGKGWDCQSIDLYEQLLLPCTGCKACRKSGVCIASDDIAPLREALLRCDVVALAAPTYFENIPGPVKNALDRLSGVAVDEKARPKRAGMCRYILLTACAAPFPFDRLAGQSSGALRAMGAFFRQAGMRKLGAVICAGATDKASLPANVEKRIRRLAG